MPDFCYSPFVRQFNGGTGRSTIQQNLNLEQLCGEFISKSEMHLCDLPCKLEFCICEGVPIFKTVYVAYFLHQAYESSISRVACAANYGKLFLARIERKM